MAKTKTAAEVSELIGVGKNYLWAKAKSEGFDFLPARSPGEPPYAVWAAEVAIQADMAKVAARDVMNGNRSKRVAMARWRAWKGILAQDASYSIKGLANCTGYNHTTILHALARLSGIEARNIKLAGRASCRVPETSRTLFVVSRSMERVSRVSHKVVGG